MSITTSEKKFGWVDLKDAAMEGKLDRILVSGDRVPLTLKTGEDVFVRATRDKNDKWFFIFEDCLDFPHSMNDIDTNYGGWAECGMRKYLNETVFELLPDELQSIIVPTRIVQIPDGIRRAETEDRLFLPSKTQMLGKGMWGNLEPEDAEIIYYQRDVERVKGCGKNRAWWYFLRTPYAGSTSAFWAVDKGGSILISSANNNGGVAPCFCIN